MIYLIPKKLHGKVTFGHNKLVLCDGVQLTPEEDELYRAITIDHKIALADRFGEKADLTPEEEEFFKEYCEKHPLSIEDCI